jgi:hypothetical protein
MTEPDILVSYARFAALVAAADDRQYLRRDLVHARGDAEVAQARTAAFARLAQAWRATHPTCVGVARCALCVQTEAVLDGSQPVEVV